MSLYAFLRASRLMPSLAQRFVGWLFGAGASAERRSRAIDVLRAVAILLVLGCHYVIAPGDSGFAAPIAEAWYRVGWTGVDLFFVLSGFLVSGLLFSEYRRTGAIDVRRFLVRRGFKIWPAYFGYLAFLALWFSWQRAHGKPIDVLASLSPNLLHFQNYFGTTREHTWSLAVEEHFYLTTALLAGVALQFAALRRLLRRTFPFIAGAALVALAASRHAEFLRVGRDGMNLYATHLRFDGLLIGTLLAYVHHFRPQALAWCRSRPLTTIVAGIILALPTMVATPDVSPWAAGVGLTTMYVGFAFVVIGCVLFERTALGAHVFGSRIAGAGATIGFFSYGIYLWHIDLVRTPLTKIAALAPSFVPAGAWWTLLAATYVGAAVAAGALMSRLIELPALALRERYFGAPTAPQPAPPRLAPAPVVG